MELDPLLSVGVFFSAMAIDAVGTWDVRKTAQGRAGEASVASMAGLVLGAINLWVFIHNPAYLLPEIAGAGIGTYVTIKIDKRHGITNIREGERPDTPSN